MTIPHPSAVEWTLIKGGATQAIDIHLTSPGWWVEDYGPVYAHVDMVGEDRQLPRGKTLPFPRYPTATVVSLGMLVFPQLDGDGNAHTIGGVRKNVEFLRDNLLIPPTNNTTGVRAATFRLHDGTTRASDVTVLDVNVNESDLGVSRADFRFIVRGTDASPGRFV